MRVAQRHVGQHHCAIPRADVAITHPTPGTAGVSHVDDEPVGLIAQMRRAAVPVLG